MNDAQIEAVANADAQTSNVALPTYSELMAIARRLAYPDAGEALILDDYRNIARNVVEPDGRRVI